MRHHGRADRQTAVSDLQNLLRALEEGELTPAELAHSDALCGTRWDEFVCMEVGDIAHYDQKGHNRWSASPAHLTVVALWVSLTALEEDIM